LAKGAYPKRRRRFFSFNDGFDIGQDLGSPVSEAYFDQAPFKFNGKINSLKAEYVK
jgi:arylsulfatase